MIYPKFIMKDCTIGITAVSAGVGSKIESFDKSLRSLKNEKLNIYETKNVRVNNEVSSTPEQRGKELKELYENKKIDMILCAAGGDFCFDMLPEIDLTSIKNNVKWIMGYSDPTSILYLITTKLDIATLYGVNAGSFDQEKLHISLKNAINILKGNIIEQKSFEKYELESDENKDGYNLTEKVEWNVLNGDINTSGRCIGGCLDVIKDIIGTKYDYTNKFIEKYKEDGIVWYFDIFSLSTDTVYRTLLQMKYAGYFKYAKAILVGRVRIPNSFTNMSYEDALKKACPNIPICFNIDIGHVPPKMIMINGAIIDVECKNKKGTINFKLK